MGMMNKLGILSNAIDTFEFSVNREEVLLKDLNSRIADLDKVVEELKFDTSILEEVARLFQKFSEREHRNIQDKFEMLISYALSIIFEGQFKSFKFINSIERNQFTIKPVLTFMYEDKEVTTDIMSSHGGGVSNIVGFLLKLLVLVFQSKKYRPVLFLDESFANLSAEYVPLIAKVINKLVTELGKDLQIILVTHQKEFIDYADRVYRFSKPKYKTVIEKMK